MRSPSRGSHGGPNSGEPLFFFFCVRFHFVCGPPAALNVSSPRFFFLEATPFSEFPFLPLRRRPRPLGGAAFRLNLLPRQVSALGIADLAQEWQKPDKEPFSFAKAEG